MKRSKILTIGALLLALTIALTACSGGGSTEIGEDQKVLVIANVSDATTLDPHDTNDQPTQRIIGQIFDSLVEFDEDMNLVPGGPVEEINQIDELTTEFVLKEGVKFHNGEPLTAKDVKFTFEKHKAEAQTSHMTAPISEIEIVDDHTVRFITEKPFPALRAHLTHGSAGILNKKAVEEFGDAINRNPVGTGPFKLEEWKTGDEVILVRNDEYYGELPEAEKVIFKNITENSARATNLESGDVNIALNLDPNDMVRIREDENLTAYDVEGLSLQYLGTNTQKENLKDPRVRQAIAYAIDADEINDTIYNGTATIAGTVIPPQLHSSNTDLKPYPYDPEKAKELLKEAGYEDGLELELWTNDNPIRKDAAVMIQSYLGAVGITVPEVSELEWGAYLDGVDNGNQELFMLGWSFSTADPDHGIGALFYSKNHGEGGNNTFYTNESVDALFDAGAVEMDEEARNKIYKDAQAIIMEELPMIPLYFDTYRSASANYIEGFKILPTGKFKLSKVTFAETVE